MVDEKTFTPLNEDCDFCLKAIPRVITMAAALEMKAPGTPAGGDARHHVTAILMKVTIDRLFEEMGGDIGQVAVVLSKCALGRYGVEADVALVQPPTAAVQDLTEEDLAAMTEIPRA